MKKRGKGIKEKEIGKWERGVEVEEDDAGEEQ